MLNFWIDVLEIFYRQKKFELINQFCYFNKKDFMIYIIIFKYLIEQD